MTGPEIGASATVDLVVREPDCANALNLSDDPATATYRGRDGKLFVFEVVAYDPAGKIGSGTHKRAIVSRDRLLAGAAKRR